jgi:hypothetical protein
MFELPDQTLRCTLDRLQAAEFVYRAAGSAQNLSHVVSAVLDTSIIFKLATSFLAPNWLSLFWRWMSRRRVGRCGVGRHSKPWEGPAYQLKAKTIS